MRPGQNKRMRGRPTNNRRGPNPLTRSYESNGPDVKIRGNAHHVAEKYLQLARDAHTGGDPVAAENYLQHAEHYFRLIAAAHAAQALAQSGQQRPPGEDEDGMDDDGDFDALSDRFASPAERQNAYPQQPQQGFNRNRTFRANAPQPFGDRPYEADRQGGNDRGGFAPRQDRQRATDFRIEVRDRIARSKSAMRVTATIDRGATIVPRDFRPYRDPQPAARGGRRGGGARGPSVLHNEPEAQQRGFACGRSVGRYVGFARPDRDAGGCSVRVRTLVGGECFSGAGSPSSDAVALRVWRSEFRRRRAARCRSGTRRRHAGQGIAVGARAGSLAEGRRGSCRASELPRALPRIRGRWNRRQGYGFRPG